MFIRCARLPPSCDAKILSTSRVADITHRGLSIPCLAQYPVTPWKRPQQTGKLFSVAGRIPGTWNALSNQWDTFLAHQLSPKSLMETTVLKSRLNPRLPEDGNDLESVLCLQSCKAHGLCLGGTVLQAAPEAPATLSGLVGGWHVTPSRSATSWTRASFLSQVSHIWPSELPARLRIDTVSTKQTKKEKMKL